MSEAEKKKRLEYKKNRKKWLIIQSIALSLVALICLGSFITYYQLNKTYYIHYTEEGDVGYKVHVMGTENYGEEWLEQDWAYIASRVDNIFAEFDYKMDVDANSVNFDYSYEIEAEYLLTDTDSGKPLDKFTDVIKEKTTKSSNGRNHLQIFEQVNIDFAKYNKMANDFINAHQLKGYAGMLIVRMNVNVISSCESFESDSQNAYTVALNIPLASDTMDINVSTTVPAGDSKVLACPTFNLDPTVFKIVGIVFAVIALLGACGFVAFIFLTRNEDINYNIKVKRLVSAYRSYIQQLEGEFDAEGYQILYIKTFNEMLGIRDTIQSPILMSENEDNTCTQFLIPTNTKILYIYEIKVENYDEIYSKPEEEIVEEPVIIEEVNEEELAEALSTPDIDIEEVDFVEDNDPEEEEGVEVIGVVWPERAHKNKVYRYDPNGEQLADGDVVLVPSRDVARNRDIIRKAAVAHGNHKVPPESLHHPLKKIIGIVKRKTEKMLTTEEEINSENTGENKG